MAENNYLQGEPVVSLHLYIEAYTLSLKSLSPLSSGCFKTTQTTGGVGVAGACPHTSKLGTFLLWSLALSMQIIAISN